MKYGVKGIYTRSVGEGENNYYEECVFSVKATSFDEACEKAEKYAAKTLGEYRNPSGILVKVEKFEVLDCFLAFDEEEDVQEIYSAFIKNSSSLNEKDFYAIITERCSAENLYDLRFSEFNS